jgi:hypothetical protein
VQWWQDFLDFLLFMNLDANGARRRDPSVLEQGVHFLMGIGFSGLRHGLE